MPRDKVNDLTTPGRYTEVSWRRDKQEPGYVQVSTHDPSMVGVYVHLDGAGIDRLIKALHKAKRQAFGEEPGQAPCDHAADAVRVAIVPGPSLSTEQVAETVMRRLAWEGRD